MYASKLLAAVVLLCASVCATAQVEFHLAYMKRVPDSSPTVFPNDHLFKFMSLTTFIGAKDFRRATASLQEGRGYVAFRVSAAAAKRFNELVKANIANQERGSFENHIGLAVVVDGQVHQVIQGVFQPLQDQTLWWTPADDRLPQQEQLRMAQAIAKKVRGGAS